MFPMPRLLTAAALIVTALPLTQAFAQDKPLTIFAAASLKNALDDTNAAFRKATGVKVMAIYAASSALARQIEQGEPADVFVSADLQWMDYADTRKLIKPETRVNLLGNRLVLIAPKDSKLDRIDITKGFDIAKFAGNGRIAVAGVKAVPAGIYAKTALERLDAWTSAEPKITMAANVRATLALVARGEAAIGIVYETDAKIDPAVKILGVFPESSHPPITYPVAVTAASSNAHAASYLNFLRGSATKTIFEHYGFTYFIKPTS